MKVRSGMVWIFTAAFVLGLLVAPSLTMARGRNTLTTENEKGGLPDLIVKDIWWSPTNPVVGDTLKVYFVVKNVGTAASGATTLEVRFFVDGEYITTYKWSASALDPNEEEVFRKTYETPHDAFLTFVAEVDKSNLVTESDEGNNKRSETIEVNESTSGGGGGGTSWFIRYDFK
jgi:subtilase family serine protease